ncbi:MAG: hypothetical protein JWO80_3247 [Bryobacterales bacterium]|nr:hypothetical protein [Bryobacterales bacterium]
MWRKVILVLVVGYVTLGRSFAYIGIPPLKIFIGELFLVAFLLFRSRAVIAEWFEGLLNPYRTTHNFSWALLLFFQYGVFEALRGISLGYSVLIALQNLVFNIYPIYFFVGLWASRDSEFLSRLVRIQLWITAIYGPAYVLFLSQVPAVLPSSNVPLFGYNGALLGILGAICLERNLARVWLPLVLNTFVMLSAQVRSEWLSCFLSVGLWSIITGRTKRFAGGLMLVAALLAIGYLADLRLPSPRGRGGELSSREIVVRAAAIIDPAWAIEHSRSGGMYAGTISWRKAWWSAIWDSVHAAPLTAMVGQAYGFRLADVVPYLRGDDIRTPHNILFYVLGHTGWLGVALFAIFLASLLHLMWRTYRLTGQLFGVLLWVAGVSSGCFGNLFESPSGAIPFYLFMGMAAAPVVHRKMGRAEEEVVTSRPVPALLRVRDANFT